jgi:ureidoglycolate lyase
MPMLHAQPITEDLLKPFATLLAAHGARRTDFPHATEPGSGAGASCLSLMRFEPEAAGPLRISRFERHPHSAQTFMPLSVARYLVVVAPSLDDGAPNRAAAKAFLAGAGQAITYHRGVWHASMIVFDRPAEMTVLMWRRSAGGDTLVAELPSPITVFVA